MLQRPAGSEEFVDALLHSGAFSGSTPAVATRTSDGWHHLSYDELRQCSHRVAGRLRARGVEPGSRVVLAASPGGPWLAVLLGVLRCGGVAVPLDPTLTSFEMEPMVARSAPAVVVGGAEMAELVGTGGGPDNGGPKAATGRAPDDPAMVVWTSGTTGAPKGVTLTFANLAYSVEQVMAGQRPSAADRWLSVLPTHHLLELCCGVLPALASGASVWFVRTLMPKEIAGTIRDHGINKMVAVPLLLRLLEPVLPGTGLATVYCGGAPLEPSVVERYAAAGISIYAGYGLTEAAPTVAMNTPEHSRAGSVGRPLAGTEIRIDSPDAAGDGEILVRSPAVMQRYWEDDAMTAGAIDAEGWLHTGDLGFVDDDGYLFVTGRSKRLVVLESGKKVQPEEVEAALGAGGCFSEVCVVGVRAKRRNSTSSAAEQVCAVVVPSSAMTAADPDDAGLQEAAAAEVARLASSLSGYKRPTLVKVHRGAFPRTLKGAPRHTEVARMVEEGII